MKNVNLHKILLMLADDVRCVAQRNGLTDEQITEIEDCVDIALNRIEHQWVPTA